MKYLSISLVFIILFFGYLYSKKVYVSDRLIQCALNNNWETIDQSSYINANTHFKHQVNNLAPRYTCDVSFRVHNLTSNKIDAKYLATSIRTVPQRIIRDAHIQRSETNFGFIKNGKFNIDPYGSRLIKLEVDTNYNYEALRVNAWLID